MIFIRLQFFLFGTFCFLSLAQAGANSTSRFAEETEAVQNFLRDHEVSRVFSWCLTEKLKCRSSVQYKNRITGEVVKSFEDRFMASEPHRSVSARAFFMEQPDGSFNVYAQDVMTNTVEIDSVDPANQGISVTFDKANDNLPTFELSFEIIGSNPVEYKKATLSYGKSFAVFTGDINSITPFHSVTYPTEQ